MQLLVPSFALSERSFLLTVGLALSPAAVLDLEAREVRVRLDFFDEGHLTTDSS